MIALDTNVLLRLLTHDDARQLAAVVRFMESHPDEDYFVSDIVLLETVWALSRLYRWPRASVDGALHFIEEKPDLEVEDRARFAAAIRAFAAGADLADELIISQARAAPCTALATFDTALLQRHASFAVKPG